MIKAQALILICIFSVGLMACQSMHVRPTATVSVGTGL